MHFKKKNQNPTTTTESYSIAEPGPFTQAI